MVKTGFRGHEAGTVLMQWLSGLAAFWVGALLAQSNGYPVKLPLSLICALFLALGQLAVVWRLRRGRLWLGSLALGLAPAYLGFYLQSQHWVSEVFILGFIMSLAALNALLAQGWRQAWQAAVDGGGASSPGGHVRGLAFTLVNIVLIGGVLLVWYFPASPLPGRWFAWVLAAGAVLNQEFIKRKFYASPGGSATVAWTATAFQAGLSLWLLVVLHLRAHN